MMLQKCCVTKVQTERNYEDVNLPENTLFAALGGFRGGGQGPLG